MSSNSPAKLEQLVNKLIDNYQILKAENVQLKREHEFLKTQVASLIKKLEQLDEFMSESIEELVPQTPSVENQLDPDPMVEIDATLFSNQSSNNDLNKNNSQTSTQTHIVSPSVTNNQQTQAPDYIPLDNLKGQ